MSNTVPCYKLQPAKQVLLKESGDLVRIVPFFEHWCEAEDPPENKKLERVMEMLSNAWPSNWYCIDYLGRCMRANPDLTFVAIHNMKLVGLICGNRGDDDGCCVWLCNFFVMPEYRWHGVGRALCDSMIEAIAARPEAIGRTQPVRIGLMTTRTSLMILFYEKFGFNRAFESPSGNKFTSVTQWDATIWQGTVNESKLKHALHEQHTLSTLEVHHVESLSDAMHEMCEKLVGLRRRQLLGVWERGAHVLECWQNGVPSGFALGLEFEHVFWLAWAVGIETHISLRLLLEQLCAAHQHSPQKHVSLMTLRGPAEAAGIAALLERLGLRVEESDLIFYKAVGINGGSGNSSPAALAAAKSAQSASSTSKMTRESASRKQDNGDSSCDIAFWNGDPPPGCLLVVPQGDFPPL